MVVFDLLNCGKKANKRRICSVVFKKNYENN